MSIGEDDNLVLYFQKGISGSSAYFEDGVRQVHYVFVVHTIEAYANEAKIEYLIRQLQTFGLEFEHTLGITVPVIFFKIHLSDDVTLRYISTFNIPQEFRTDFNYSDPYPHRCSCLKTPIGVMNVYEGIKQESTSLTKIKIISTLLLYVSYDTKEESYGIEKILHEGILQDYYALHDGMIQKEYWQNNDLLNDRTLLAKYWAGYGIFYKNHPLDLIRKYYGSKLAFYVAWVDFYNKLLAPVAITGLTLYAYSLIQNYLDPTTRIKKICSSNSLMCGICMDKYGCQQRELLHYCDEFKFLSTLENISMVTYSILVNIWGLLMLAWWKRRELFLKVRWNLMEAEEEVDFVRLDFRLKSKQKKVHGKTVYYIDRSREIGNYILGGLYFTAVVMGIITFIFANILLGIVVNSSFLKRGLNSHFMMNWLTPSIQAIFTITMSKKIPGIVESIISVIFPKTQKTYNQIDLYMIFSLDFINNTAPLVLSGFFRKLNYNLPTPQGVSVFFYNTCDPVPCLYPLFTQTAIFILFKSLLETVCILSYRKIRKIIRAFRKIHIVKNEIPPYEDEFHLQSFHLYKLHCFYTRRAIQYGVLIGFTYSFPLAPILVFIHNTLSIRMEAHDLIHKCRRPPASRAINGIGPFYKILAFATIVSSLCNSCSISYLGLFGRDLALQEEKDNEKSLFSVYQPQANFGTNPLRPILPDTCLYRDDVYPPGHKLEYQRKIRYWKVMELQTVAVTIYEIFLFIIFMFFRHIIQPMPVKLKKQICIDRTNLKNKYNQLFNKKLEERITEVDKRTPDIDVESPFREAQERERTSYQEN